MTILETGVHAGGLLGRVILYFRVEGQACLLNIGGCDGEEQRAKSESWRSAR